MKKRTLKKMPDGGKIPKLKDNIQSNKSDNTRTNYAPISPKKPFTPKAWTTNINEIQSDGRPNPNIPGLEDATLDAMGLIELPIALGKLATKGLAKAGVNSIKDIHKINPYAFKPNPESYYRMIGDEGLADLQNVGHVRSNPNTFYKDKHPFFSKGYPIDGRIGKSVVEDSKYLGNNMIEVGGNNEIGNRFVKNRWADAAPDPNIFVARDRIGIDNPNLKIFEKDWLRGYKEVPKKGFNSEINWGKWNKEIPENTQLMKEYNAIDYRKNPLSDKEKEMYQWFDEQMRFDKLPETTNKQSIEVLDNFKQRIKTPEGQKRLKELGITEEQLLQDLKIVEDPNTYGYYRGLNKNTIAINPNHPLPKKVVRHEIEHGVQNALRKSKINKAIDGTPAEKLKALEINTTEIDDILSELTLRREGTPNKVWNKINTNETVNINDYKSLINNKQNATDYFLTGSDGAEKSAFLGEVQQYMMDAGKIPKNSYVQITPEMVKETMADAMFDEKTGGKYLRLFNIIKADPKNYEIISKGLNKMLSITPLIGAGAYMQNKDFNMGKYKNGGTVKRSLNKYELGGTTKNNMSSSINTIIPFLGTGLSLLDTLTSNPDGSPKNDKVSQYLNRTNPLSNINRISQGKDVGRSLLNLTGIGAFSEGVGLNDKLFGKSDYIKDAELLQEQENSRLFTQKRLGTINNSVNTITTNNENMYPHGGVVTTNQPGAVAELELQEQMQLPDGTVMGVDGPSHESGGIEVNVPEGTRVFSDRLKLGKKTFANHAKIINNKIAKLDNKPTSSAKTNTEMLFNKQLDNLFNTQEEMKAIKEQKRSFKNKFPDGGIIYNPNMAGADLNFQNWYAKNTLEGKNNVPYSEKLDYDYYSFYKNKGQGNIEGHFPDTYKRPNHPTFSNESSYSGNGAKGYWENDKFIKYNNGGVIPAHNVTLMPNGGEFWGKAFAKGAQSVYGDVGKSAMTGVMTDQPETTSSGFNVSPQNMAFASTLMNNVIQNNQINKLKKPRTINPVTFTAGDRPDRVSYSNERAAIDSEAIAAKQGLKFGSGSYSTQTANLQKIRNAQLMGKGRSFQTEANANTGVNNSYKAQQAAAYNQGVQANLGIDQYNLENQYNYDLWKTGNKLKATGAMGDNMVNLFNNQTSFNNQMKYWDVVKGGYSGNIGADIDKFMKKKNGGTIRTLKKK